MQGDKRGHLYPEGQRAIILFPWCGALLKLGLCMQIKNLVSVSYDD